MCLCTVVIHQSLRALAMTALYMLSDTVGALLTLSPSPAHMSRGDLELW